MSFTFRDLLRQAATRFEERPAVVDLANGMRATYGEVDGRANRLANAFLAKGLATGDVVALMLPNGLHYLESEFAVAKAGLVRVGLIPSLDDASIAVRLAALAPKAIILAGSQVGRVKETCRQAAIAPLLIAVGGGEQAEDYEALLERHPASEPVACVEAHHPCSLRFTSGSVGAPKAVLHDQKACAQFALLQLLEPNWGKYYGKDERYLQHAHLSTGTIMWVHATYACGGVVVILPEYTAAAALGAIAEHRITMFFASPSVISEMVEHPDFSTFDVSSVRTVMVGGAPFAPAKRAQARKALGEVFIDYYSATEYPLTLTMQRGEHRDGALGRALLGVQVKVVDEDNNEVPPGEAGRLVVRGDNVLREYWQNPEATKRVLHDGWVDIGDLARMDADGVFSFVERQPEVIRINGKPVYPTQVETALAAHPAVREVSVFATGGAEVTPVLHAVVLLKANQSASVADLTAICRTSLPTEAVPSFVHISSEPLPKSPLGKIMRKTLQATYSAKRLNVSVSADLKQPAESAWAAIRDFCTVDRWLPGIERVESEDAGKRRRIVLPDGKIVLEQEVARDEQAMTLSYTVTESPMPFTDYLSTMTVQPTADGCTVRWSVSLVPLAAEDKVVRLMNGLYRSGLKGLEGYLGAQRSR